MDQRNDRHWLRLGSHRGRSHRLRRSGGGGNVYVASFARSRIHRQQHDFVTQLGVFDSGANGLNGTITSQLWRNDVSPPVKVAELIFDTANPGTLIAGNRFKPLATPLFLTPGTYTISAFGYSAANPAGRELAGGPTHAQKTFNNGSGAIIVHRRAVLAIQMLFPRPSFASSTAAYSAATFQFSASPFGGQISTDVSVGDGRR